MAQDREGWTALMTAVHEDDADRVVALLAAGAVADRAVNAGSPPAGVLDAVWVGLTPLLLAADRGYLDVVKALMGRADVNKPHFRTGVTAAYLAAARGRTAMLRVLVENNAELDRKRSGGWTAAYIAAYDGHLECLELLADHGADLNTISDNG